MLPVTLPEPKVLNREELLIATLRAASAEAGGNDDSEVQLGLEGAKFEFPIRFGCAAPPAPTEQESEPKSPGGDAEKRGLGPSSERPPATKAIQVPEAMGWTYDAEARRLRVHATPDIDLEHPVVAAVAGSAIEAAEGFWIPRPWLLSAACPSGRAAPSPAVSQKGVSVGIVQFFTATDARTERRENRPYESVQNVQASELEAFDDGFDLVLSGRLKASNGKMINCVGRGSDAPPTCLISVEFGSVRLVRAETRSVLAQWGQD